MEPRLAMATRIRDSKRGCHLCDVNVAPQAKSKPHFENEIPLAAQLVFSFFAHHLIYYLRTS